jgi:hypothetical protein
MNSKLESEVRGEVEALHNFFVGWFTGRLPLSAFETEFLFRFDGDFLLIPPAGGALSLDEFQQGLHQMHGTNPEFRIAIRNVKIRRVKDSQILATYEEWQRNALASKPPDNARIASVIFDRTQPLQWIHVHETWLPESIASAGPYDF